MKKILFLLSAAGCLVLPALTHADTPAAKGKKTVKSATVAPAPTRSRLICYITNEPRTGSLIPMVYRRYEDRLDSASNAGVYGSTAIRNSSTLDVGATLYKLDPSITFRRGR